MASGGRATFRTFSSLVETFKVADLYAQSAADLGSESHSASPSGMPLLTVATKDGACLVSKEGAPAEFRLTGRSPDKVRKGIRPALVRSVCTGAVGFDLTEGC